MMLELTRDDARLLRELLEDYLPQLRREVARTEVQALHHAMVERQELCERILLRLTELALDVPATVATPAGP